MFRLTGGAGGTLVVLVCKHHDGFCMWPVTVEALDKEGRHVPTANLPVEFEIKGPGAIIGVGNGNPNSHEPEKGNKCRLFNRLAQVILQSQRSSSGSLVLCAKAEGLSPAEATVNVQTVPQPPAVLVIEDQ